MTCHGVGMDFFWNYTFGNAEGRGGGSRKPRFHGNYDANLKLQFLEGWRLKPLTPSIRGLLTSSGKTHY